MSEKASNQLKKCGFVHVGCFLLLLEAYNPTDDKLWQAVLKWEECLEKMGMSDTTASLGALVDASRSDVTFLTCCFCSGEKCYSNGGNTEKCWKTAI